MCLIDRYLLTTFLQVFLISFFSLFGMYVIGDFVNNLKEFLDLAEQQGGLIQAMCTYYGPSILWFFDLTGMMVALTSAVFTITWLQRYQEMTALMAAGISARRIVRPLWIAAAAISLLASANREWGIPAFREHLSFNVQDRTGRTPGQLQPRHDHLTNIVIDGARVNPREQSIEGPRFLLPPECQPWGTRLQGARAEYRSATDDHPAGYLIRQLHEPGDPSQRPSCIVDRRTVIFSPHDQSWLAANECFVASEIDFASLLQRRGRAGLAPTRDIIQQLRNPSLDPGSDVRVALHARLVQPALDMALIMSGLTIVLSRRSRNVFVAVGMCLLLVVGFTGIVLVCHTLGINYLVSPALAAWSPLFVIVPFSAAYCRIDQ